jgi:hypothetical protein
MPNEKLCGRYIMEPNGLEISVAKAINGGDFQAARCCKNCKMNCEDDEDEQP